MASRDLLAEGTDDNQTRVPVQEQEQAVGHAVRANYLYAGLTDLCVETDNTALLSKIEKVWEDVASRKVYITGACGALYDGASPDGAKKQSAIARVHQAYGRAYQLPNRNQIAVMRGPLVYCLESGDLPAGVGTGDIMISVSDDLEPRYDSDLLDGVVVLEGKAGVRRQVAWDSHLYREYRPELVDKEIDLRMVPYYAWDNRGMGQMRIWLPLGR